MQWNVSYRGCRLKSALYSAVGMPKQTSYSTIAMSSQSQSYLVSDENNSFWKRRTGLEKTLIVLSLLSFIIIVGLIIAICIEARTKIEEEIYPICDSKICQEFESQLISSINTSINPCDDFYSYVCSGWEKSNPLPPTESSWNAFDIIDEQIMSELEDILKGLNSPEINLENKIMNLFNGCMDQDRRESIGGDCLINMAEKLGGWPLLGGEFNESYDWEKSIAWVIRELGSEVIFSVFISTDEKNSTINMLHIDYASLGLGRNEFLNRSNERSIDVISAYKKLMENTVNYLNSSNSESDITKDIEDLIQFETNLANLTRPNEDRRIPETLYHKMTVSDLQNITGENINILFFLSDIFQDITNITGDMEIIVVEKEYLKNVVQLLQNTDKRIIANYIGWRIINQYSSLATESLRKINFEFSKVDKGISKMRPIGYFCSSAVNDYLSYAVGNIFINRTFKEETKIEVERMIEDLKDAFRSFLTASNWMDIETSRKAKEKLKEMIPLVAYPPWIMNEEELNKYYEKLGDIEEGYFFQGLLDIDKFLMDKELMKINQLPNRSLDSWFETPTTVNAFYSPQTNTIAFPAGILRIPFYEFGLPNSINYGAIGTVIGHEITHGFDDEGSRYDQFGNLRPWWSSKMREVFNNKTECFVNQYSNYVDSTTNMHLNGRNTLGENIADNGGLRAAFKAYQLYLTKYGSVNNKVLPNLKLNPEQLFFVGFSYVWCTNQNEERLMDLIEYNPHSPSQFRVWGALSNNQDFYNAFHCEPKSKMFSETKCSLW